MLSAPYEASLASSAAAVVTAVAVACACWLMVPGRARVPASNSSRRGAIGAGWAGLVTVTLALVVALGLAGPRVATVVLLGAAVAWAVERLVRRGARRRRAARTGGQVRESCDLLAAELAVGLPSGAALRRAAEAWPALAAVARASALGGDVPSAWREAATAPGAADLRLVGAAWQVAHRTGDGLAAAMMRVSDELRRNEATRRVVAAELASARATARLLAGLPVVALAMGMGAGGDPLGFLFGSPVGLTCLVAGVALGMAGLWWIETIADGVAGGPGSSPGSRR